MSAIPMTRPETFQRHTKIVGKIKAWAWKIFTFPFLGLIYWIIIAAGLRGLIPELGTKIHRLPLPLVSRLRHLEGGAALDLAHMFALLLFIAVAVVLTRVMWIYFAPREFFARCPFDPVKYTRFVMTLAVALVGCDAVLFYAGLSQAGLFGGSVFSIPALLATIAYIGVLAFVSFVSVSLEKTS